jgi:hypothetical protein
MAIQLKIGSQTVVFIVLVVVGYIVALLSLLNDAPTYNIILENHIEKISLEMHSLKSKLAMKDSQLKSLKHGKVDSLGDSNSSGSRGGDADTASTADKATTSNSQNVALRPGVIVLGMHRSGTSILGGLLNKLGLKTGGPLIGPAEVFTQPAHSQHAFTHIYKHTQSHNIYYVSVCVN